MEASPFNQILARFLARVPGAMAAALVDGEGETVDYAGKYNLYDLKVTAAHFRILLESAGLLAGSSGPAESLVVRGARRSVLALLAPQGYAVVCVLRRRAGFASHRVAAELLIDALCAEAGWGRRSASRWTAVDVARDPRGRPTRVGFPDEPRGLPLQILGTFGPASYRVRTDDGHEFNLVREPKNAWYADARRRPTVAP